MLVTCLGVGLAANLCLGGYQLHKITNDNHKVSKFIDQQLEKQAKEEEKENTYQEDGYLVGESYEIRSTKKISDAYINGDASKLKGEDKKTYDMAKEILERETRKCKNNYEKEVAIYNWMFENIKQGASGSVIMPNSNSNEFTPYGVLTGKNAVCVGYATTFRLFMNMLGMDCHIVHNEYHSWDMVQLDDGAWYQVDIYTDVSNGSRYYNFNMNDVVAKSEHEWDGSALPEAKGTKYLYPVRNAKEVKDFCEIPKLMKKALDRKKSGVFCKFAKKLKEEDLQMANPLIMQTYNVLAQVPEYSSCSVNAMWYPDGNDSYVLAIFFSYYNSDTTEEHINKKLEKKLEKAFEKVFKVELDMSAYTSNASVDDEGVTVDTTTNN